MSQPYLIQIDTDKLKVLVARTHFPFSDPEVVRQLGDAIRRSALIVQARAVRNVSGYPVVAGLAGIEAFRIMVRTGTLKQSIEMQWPYGGTVFTARVWVNAAFVNPGSIDGARARPRPVSAYADAIERGHPPIDLKKTMQGKIVPFFGAETKNPAGPYATGGLVPLDPSSRGPGSRWQSEDFNRKLATMGKDPMIFTRRGGASLYGDGSGTHYQIAFRRVGKTGWVIPAAKPRPFMRAATIGTARQVQQEVTRSAASLFTNL